MNELLRRAQKQLIAPGNIDLSMRPIVPRDDGSFSTVDSFSFQDDDGSEVLIPMVAPNGTMFPNQDAAISFYKQTGQHLGKFRDWRAADIYAEALHKAQERQYAPRAEALTLAKALQRAPKR